MKKNNKEMDWNYYVTLRGKYNVGVYACPECNVNFVENLFQNIIGWSCADSSSVLIFKCPECFNCWYFDNADYDGLSYYSRFIESVKTGTNIHYR